jgi:hypothetical protein
VDETENKPRSWMTRKEVKIDEEGDNVKKRDEEVKKK